MSGSEWNFFQAQNEAKLQYVYCNCIDALWLNSLVEGTNNYLDINIFLANFFGMILLFYVEQCVFLPNWPYFECIWPFWSYLASFCHFGLQKWLFSYMNLKNFFLYCQVKAILGNVEQSSFKHSCKKGFLGTNVITLLPPAHWKF